jgi:hypothetical protein
MAVPNLTWTLALCLLLASTFSAQHQIVRSGQAGGGYAAFPDVCRLQNGDLYCVFYSGYGRNDSRAEGDRGCVGEEVSSRLPALFTPRMTPLLYFLIVAT